jgi:hypothetical protein
MTAAEKLALKRVKTLLAGGNKGQPMQQVARIWPTPYDLHRDLSALVAIVERTEA